MAEKTLIAWTDHTFNIAWGCVKISPGCKNCYADDMAGRYGHDLWGKGKARRTFGDKHWNQPHQWDAMAACGEPGVLGPNSPRLVFTSSMCDVFEDHPTIDAERAKLWPLIRATPGLHWQILTKRPERIVASLPDDWGAHGYPNVWLGTSIENADYAFRAARLRTIPAVCRFISYEPALGPLAGALDFSGIDWVIYGGESGNHRRLEDKQWARDMRDACTDFGVAFFHKQSSHRFTERGIELDGEIIRQYPTPRKVV